MKNAIAIVCTLALWFPLPALGAPLLGEKQVFPLLQSGAFASSPTGQQFAVVSRFTCQLYRFDSASDRWRGPYEADKGGYFGRKEEPDIDQGTRPTVPLFGWTIQPDGIEALVLNPVTNRAVILSGTKFTDLIASSDILTDLYETQTGRLRKTTLDAPPDVASKLQGIYLDIKGRDPAAGGFVSLDGLEQADLPETLEVLWDVSPSHDRVLCRPTESDPLLSLSLLTGERIPFPIRNRPRALNDDMSGSFSPDGEYVLIQYSYGPDDHYSGGYLQLFTKAGEYLEEVAEFSKDVPAPVGFHQWLHNNWIVYSNGKELVFQKFIAKP